MATKIYTNAKRVRESNRKVDDEPNQDDKPFINSTPLTSNRYDVFIDTDIGSPAAYRDLNFLLNTASEDDHFNLYINSPGGQLNTALMIIESLKVTEASTTAIIQGECHSAASMITMYCQEVHVLDSAHMLLHTATYGTVGNTSNVKAHTEFTTRQVEKLITDTYSGFLSPEEIEKVKLGIELWFDAEEIRERLEDRIEYLKSQEEDKTEDKNGEEIINGW